MEITYPSALAARVADQRLWSSPACNIFSSVTVVSKSAGWGIAVRFFKRCSSRRSLENAKPDAGQWSLRISAPAANSAAEKMRTRAILRDCFKRWIISGEMPQRGVCLKSPRVLLSLAPGFSPVTKDRENHWNRFNGNDILDSSTQVSDLKSAKRTLAWSLGWSAAKPQDRESQNNQSPRSGRQSNHHDSRSNRTSIGRFAGSAVFGVDDPGVPLRSTPGFMPSSAPRTLDRIPALMSQVYYYRFNGFSVSFCKANPSYSIARGFWDEE